jgi:ABC-type multidrug transport system fused ATPase/permease subunit
MAILEELEKISGQLEVQGSVFYVPQEPWIFTASVRQNIIFGKPYNKEKFDKIIQVCCLQQVNYHIVIL